MKNKIKIYFENLNSKRLGLKNKIKVNSISKLGMGTGNLNYLVIANKKKFIFRLNMALNNPKKSKKEYEALKVVEKLNIAPRVWILDESRKIFDQDFIILDYLEGKTSEKIKPYLNPKLVKAVAKLTAKIHSIRITSKLRKLNKEEHNYQSFLKEIKKRIKYIKHHIKDKKFIEIIDRTYKKIVSNIPFGKYKHPLTLTQGDVCEQNIVVYKDTYELIDWEDLHLIDPASEIAGVFTDFGKPFDEKQKQLFLKEYFKIRKDKTLKERIKSFIPLKIFSIFLWSIEHNLKIKNKQMHTDFLKNNVVEEDIAYAKICFKRALRAGIIDKKYKNFNLEKMLR